MGKTQTIKTVSQSPNSQKINQYVQQQAEQKTEQKNEREQDIGVEYIEQQFNNFVKEIQQYDQILSKITKNINEYQDHDLFITDFYPVSALNNKYDVDQQKKIIASTDQQIAKILTGLERNNTSNKQQLKAWYFQYAKNTRITQLLISQNKLLRKYVANKNKQIVKLIQAIKQTQNEQQIKLQQKLDGLKQQNRILVDHLKQIKKTIKNKQQQQQNLIQIVSQSQKNKLMLQYKLKQLSEYQEHSTKHNTLVLQSEKQSILRHNHNLSQRQRLLNLTYEYQTHKQFIQNQLKKYKIDKKDIDQLLKNRWNTQINQKNKAIKQLDNQHQQNIQITKKNKFILLQINNKQNILQQYQRINITLQKKLVQLQQIKKSKSQQLINVQNYQINMLSQIDVLDVDIQQLKQQIQNKQQQYRKQKQKINQDYRKFQLKKKNQVKKWTQQSNRGKKQYSQRIKQQKYQISLKNKQIQQMMSDITAKKKYYEQLMKQMRLTKKKSISVRQSTYIFPQ